MFYYYYMVPMKQTLINISNNNINIYVSLVNYKLNYPTVLLVFVLADPSLLYLTSISLLKTHSASGVNFTNAITITRCHFCVFTASMCKTNNTDNIYEWNCDFNFFVLWKLRKYLLKYKYGILLVVVLTQLSGYFKIKYRIEVCRNMISIHIK